LLGYRIKNGRIQGRVKNTMISGNVYDALNKIVAIGDTAEWVGGSLSTPPICCLGVTVSKKS
ncbi:MAG: TldD/PmbA family protein, partial [Chloroflexi bacterium]|nr:TldD/PmbA family protein [Chloroflexota bacterium]